MNKIDPICGMKGTIQAHDHWFCSQHCVKVYEKQWASKNPSIKNMQGENKKGDNKRIAYILIWIILIGWFLAWRYSFMRQFMGWFFIVVALLKLIDLKWFASAYGNYDIITRKRPIWWYLYPFIELFLGIEFLIGWHLSLTALVTLALMIVGAIGVGIKLAKKEKFRCACLGTKLNIPLTNLTLVEDILMAVMACMILLQ